MKGTSATANGISMDIDHLPKKLAAMSHRVRALYQKGGAPTEHDAVLSRAFEELAIALEELREADQARRRDHELWLDERAALEAEILRYQDLFDQAPIGYLITSPDGCIRQANGEAASMLGTQ